MSKVVIGKTSDIQQGKLTHVTAGWQGDFSHDDRRKILCDG